MTNAEMICSDFWRVFDEILIENGEPFKSFMKCPEK